MSARRRSRPSTPLYRLTDHFGTRLAILIAKGQQDPRLATHRFDNRGLGDPSVTGQGIGATTPRIHLQGSVCAPLPKFVAVSPPPRTTLRESGRTGPRLPVIATPIC